MQITEYLEFRIVLAPVGRGKGDPQQWSVGLKECPVKDLNVPKKQVKVTLKRSQLDRLRSQDGWPNEDELRQIGKEVWNSVMTPELAAAYKRCCAVAAGAHNNLHVVVTLLGSDERVLDDEITLAELPIEAIRDPHEPVPQFIATSLLTPVSRSLEVTATAEPYTIDGPLRVLAVVAAPKDKPPINGPGEVAAIEQAMRGLLQPGGPVQLRFCDPPTYTRLRELLREETWHVLHFAGHGGFEVVGDDTTTPRAYLSFERPGPAPRDSFIVDAEMLGAELATYPDLKLVVLTACSSAAPGPRKRPFPTLAFDGIAHHILGDPYSGPSAVVAMQFDLETNAAAWFSGEFYKGLLEDLSLDEVVTRSRLAIIAESGSFGQRSWVNPTVYWRCREGRVFSGQPTAGLDPGADAKLEDLDRDIEIDKLALENRVRELEWLAEGVRAESAKKTKQLEEELQRKLERYANLQGETVQLAVVRGKPGEEIICPVSVRLRSPATVSAIQFEVRFPPDSLTFLRSTPNHLRPPTNLAAEVLRTSRDRLRVRFSNPDAKPWRAGEAHNLGALQFRVAEQQTVGLVDLVVEGVQAQGPRRPAKFQGTKGLVIIESPNRPRYSLSARRFQGSNLIYLGVFGLTARSALANDSIRIDVTGTSPAYHYLIAFNTDGKEQLLYPCDDRGLGAEARIPESVKDFSYPPRETQGYPLNDGPGLQAVVLVSSLNKLPPYREWRQRLNLTWSSSNSDQPWVFDGRHFTGMLRGGPPVDLVPPSFVAVCTAIRKSPGLDDVQAVAFPVK